MPHESREHISQGLAFVDGFGIRCCGPDTIFDLSALGDINDDRESAVVSDQVWIATESDEARDFGFVRVDTDAGTCHWAEVFDEITGEAPALDDIFFDFACEEIAIDVIGLDILADDQFNFEGGFIFFFGEHEDVPDHAGIGRGIGFHVVSSFGCCVRSKHEQCGDE